MGFVRRLCAEQAFPGLSFEQQDVCKKVTKAIACGAVRVLGTVEEVRARGAMPLHLNPLTVETSKSRLCVDQRELNRMSKWPKVELDGLQSIELDVRGRAVHGVSPTRPAATSTIG